MSAAMSWAEFFAERKHAGMGSFWLPPEIEREMPLGFICGVTCNVGPNGEPIACGFKQGHDGEHAWAVLPTFVENLEEAGLDVCGELVGLRAACRAVIDACDQAWDEDGVSVGAVLHAIGVPLHALRALVADDEAQS